MTAAVGAPLPTMRRAIPTRPLCPENLSPRPAARAAAHGVKVAHGRGRDRHDRAMWTQPDPSGARSMSRHVSAAHSDRRSPASERMSQRVISTTIAACTAAVGEPQPRNARTLSLL